MPSIKNRKNSSSHNRSMGGQRSSSNRSSSRSSSRSSARK